MNATQFIENLKVYITTQLDILSKNTPIINITKPIINRIIDKNINKVTTILNLVADESGNIDVENILNEIFNNIISSEQFTINIPIIGNTEIGGGFIKLNIPFTDKQIVLNKTDFTTFKDMITNK